jgi:hypothetical protein
MLLPVWNHEAPEDRKLGRNFVIRTGPLALIGLDTGEDKPDGLPFRMGGTCPVRIFVLLINLNSLQNGKRN